jgi:hypothetical protein
MIGRVDFFIGSLHPAYLSDEMKMKKMTKRKKVAR